MRRHAMWVTLVLSVAASRYVLAEQTPAGLQAGAATSNISPWLGVSMSGHMEDRKATHIHDELRARCMVLADGKKKLAIAVCDNCLVAREVFDEAKQLAQQKTGIPVENMLMSATHTHYGPAAAAAFQTDADKFYQHFMARRIADGIQRAHTNLAPAKIGWAVGSEPNQVFCRRWKMKPGVKMTDPFGKGTDTVRMNPPVGSPDLVEPAGPIDPDVTVLSLQSPDGRPVAVLANYSLHYVGGCPGNHISADYYGFFNDRFQQLIGADRLDPPFVPIMSNGTSGNINNINFRGGQKPQPLYGQMRLVGNAVAEAANQAYRQIAYRSEAPLGVRQRTMKLGVRQPTPDELNRAKDIVAKAKGPVMKTLEEIYARETILIAEYPKEVELIVQVMRIGDLAIVALPTETFTEVGLELKARSPFKPTCVIELANGYNGYLPTPEQHDMGGYETWRARSSYLERDASTKLVAAALAMLDELK